MNNFFGYYPIVAKIVEAARSKAVYVSADMISEKFAYSGRELRDEYGWDGNQTTLLEIKEKLIKNALFEFTNMIHQRYRIDFGLGFDYERVNVVIMYRDLVPGNTSIGFELYTTEIKADE